MNREGAMMLKKLMLGALGIALCGLAGAAVLAK